MGRPLEVMSVDDDKIFLKLTSVYIKGYLRDCRISEYSDPSMGLFRLKTNPHKSPDILLVDLCMEEPNGLQFINQINQHYQWKGMSRPPFKIVLITAYWDFEGVCTHPGCHAIDPCSMQYPDSPLTGSRYCPRLPIDACVPKPINKDKLKEIFDPTGAISKTYFKHLDELVITPEAPPRDYERILNKARKERELQEKSSQNK